MPSRDTTLTDRLTQAFSVAGEKALDPLARELGFADPRKTAANISLLREVMGDDDLLVLIVLAALPAADPDAALNNLERLTATVPADLLIPVLREEASRGHLLTILGASGFLTGILCRKPDYFSDLFPGGELTRRKTTEAMLPELRLLVPDGADFAALQAGLRRYKAREILRIGSRDLCGLAEMAEVTAELSDLAAASLQRAYEISDALLRREFGAPLLEAGGEAEFTIFGMGKLGGRELNFSSDIDLIYFYSSELGETAGIDDGVGGKRNRLHLHQYFVKLGELISRALHEPTADGFVFRVDLRLRPEGERGEMANSVRGAEVYYESWGQSWERAAMLKARPLAGSIPLGEGLLRNLDPFIYRRFLDYGMVEDIKTMKQKIDHSLAREREGEQNIKLGRGGIREIEFFIQALQLIYAGKKPALRERNSLKALELLRRERLVEEAAFSTLREAYIFLRNVEHRIQVVQERQTQSLPTRDEELRALARRCGFSDRASFEKELERHRAGVQAIFRDLFYTPEEEIREEVRPEVAILFDPTADSDLVKDLLEEKGFKNPDGAYDALVVLRDGGPRVHLTERTRRLLGRIAPLLMQEVLDSPEPDMAFLNLERFLSALRARGTFYALLAENREIIKLLISLFGTSLFLSRIFIQHPEILDALVSRSYARIFKERPAIAADLDELFGAGRDYEARLDLLRRFRNEEFLRIALNDISGQIGLKEVSQQLSCLAEVCLEKAMEMAREELIPRYGLPFCNTGTADEHPADFAVLGMGKLGGAELNYHSDLDIIFIYEGEGENRPVEGTDPERFRSLTNPEYFARLAQRVISVLTLMTREGCVYQIDTRLRPSGNQGPLVTSLAAYRRYHQDTAQVWERQALTKARVVAGPTDFAARIEALNQELVYERPVPEGLAEEIARLRGRMETEIAKEGAETFNIKTGRGGMVDVEFLVQYLQLLHGGTKPALRQNGTMKALDELHREKLLDEADYQALSSGYQFLRRLENKLRILHDHSISELSGERDYLAKLARRLGYPDRPRRPEQVFLEDYREVTEKIRAVFDRHLATRPEGGGG